jgi:hypothetical protein
MNDETLLTLKDASEILFQGKISPEVLKAEWRKGNLELSKIGRSWFAPVSAFRELVAKCRVEAPARASGSIKREAHGQSLTAEAAAAQASLLMKLDGLKKPSGTTSRRNTRLEIRPRHSSRMS